MTKDCTLTWNDAAGEFTLEQAVKAYEVGVSMEVNDGKDITVRIEREPKTGQSL